MADGPALTVMIPLGGLGSRFAKEGYTMRTKPFVRVLGKEMILWLTDNLNLRSDDVLVIVYNPAFSNIKVCMECLLKTKLWDRVRFVELKGPTRGAAETVLLGIEGLPAELQSRPTMLCDGDTFYTADIVSKYRAVAAKGRNGVFCFADDQEKPIYSYITVPDRATNVISDIKEKVKISNLANSGCYCFADGRQLAKYCVKIIDEALLQQSQDGVGEFYTSGVIKVMLDERPGGEAPSPHVFEAMELSKGDMQVLGTPAQVAQFCKEWPHQPALRFIFDMDNTLCTAPVVPGDYSSCLPIPHTIDYLRQVKAQGHTVVVATARRMRTHQHNVAAVVADVGKLTMDWLSLHGIEYDEIFFGKPWGHFYIDDLAICPFQGGSPDALAKQTGFYPTHVKASAAKGGGGPGVVLRDSEKNKAESPSPSPPAPSPAPLEKPIVKAKSPPEGFWTGLLVGVAASAVVAVLVKKKH